MKSFFKYLLASITGFFISLLLLIIIILVFISALISYSNNEIVSIEENTTLYLNFSDVINDRTPAPGLIEALTFEPSNKIGLNDILKYIKKAKTDPKIEGIFMELSSIQAGISTIDEIREALIDFKESGKFIKTYSEYMSQGAYYLATASDEIYLNPEGIILFKGLNAQIMFYKGLMDKLNIEAQVVRHGTYKSAVEPFIGDKMSEANREQTRTYIQSIWKNMLHSISEARGIDSKTLNDLADNLKIKNPKDALKYKLVDQLLYKDEVLEKLNKLSNHRDSKTIKSISLAQYTRTKSPPVAKTRDQIAIIYASGTIGPGKGNDAYVGSAGVSRAIRNARTNDNIKAIVFRINSGGGDVVASEVIRREIELAVKEKPVIASYGDISASGAYWISCQATRIIANKTCLTGSIGVYAMIPNFQGLLNDKLGITIENVSSNKHSSFISLYRPLTELERSKMQSNIEQTYDTFINLVADGRGLEKDFINEIGKGRVWSGENALELGLIDEFGGLNKAIEIAAKYANIDKYRIIELPKQQNPIEAFARKWNESMHTKLFEANLGTSFKFLKNIQELANMKGTQARLPFDFFIE